MNILITGSREGVSESYILAQLKSTVLELDPSPTIIHGGAPGTDTAACLFAQSMDLREIIIRPDYQSYPSHLAPLMRNTELVDQADMVLCFWGKSRYRKGGTFDTFKKAMSKNLTIIEFLANGKVQHHFPQPSLF